MGLKAHVGISSGLGERSSRRRNRVGKVSGQGQQTAPVPLLCTAPGVTAGHSFHITSPTWPVTQNIHLSASPVLWLIHRHTELVKEAANSHQQLHSISHREKKSGFPEEDLYRFSNYSQPLENIFKKTQKHENVSSLRQKTKKRMSLECATSSLPLSCL